MMQLRDEPEDRWSGRRSWRVTRRAGETGLPPDVQACGRSRLFWCPGSTTILIAAIGASFVIERWIFRDANHISVEKNRRLGPLLEAVIEDSLQS